MSESGKAVFLSYASQDAAAVQRICDALRAAGVEVWFDQNELVGGDAWDAKIRKQIAECALFVPIISANTQARGEGYFRIEWRLAAQRTHAMADDQAFLLPVVIDETRDADARVPGEFKAVQWTRLRQAYGGQAREGAVGEGGEGRDEALGTFCARVQKLLDGAVDAGRPRPAMRGEGTPPPRHPSRPWLMPTLAVLAGVVGLAVWQLWPTGASKPVVGAGKAPAAASPAEALVAKARVLLEDDPLRTRRNLELAEQFCTQAMALDPANAEALAAAAWVNFLFLDENYDDTPQRRADLRRHAEAAALLDPQSVNAQLALCGVLIATGNRPEAVKKLSALAELHPRNLTVLRHLAWAAAWRSDSNWGTTAEDGEAALERLRAHSPLGRSHADSILASRHWARGEYVQADRLVDGIFAAGNPVRTTYLNRLLVLAYGWGDLERAKAFIATIPEKLLLEDVFIYHVATVWIGLGDCDRALATLNRTQRELLHEARVELPTALLRGNAQAAAGRLNAAQVEWRAARQVVERQLQADPRNAAAQENLLEILVRLGEREAAERQYTLLLEMVHPTEGSVAWARWYEHFVRIGDFDAAVPRLDRLIARDHGRWANAYNELRHEPLLAKFRQDPRVQPILARAAGWLEEMRAAAAAPAKPDLSAVLSTVGSGKVEGLAKGDKSIAVLAFANLSDDKANEYFSDGISEELLNVLAKIPGLKVSARTSAFSFKGKNTPIPEIAKQLGVAYVVEGSVRKAGNQVRITAQLIKAADGFHVWSDTFTRELKDVFAVQDEIAGLIAKTLSLQLGASSAATAAGAMNPEAYRLYLEGRAAWNRRDTTGFRQAEELFNRALEIEPRFARLHAALADVWAIRAGGSFKQRNSPMVQQSVAKAEQAVALDQNSAEAHASLGHSLGQAWRGAEALRAFRRAIQLNPNYASAHQWLGRHLLAQADLEEALVYLRRAAELDPLSHRILDNYSDALVHAGRLEEAGALLARAAALHPSGVQIRCKQALLLARQGRRAEALAAARVLVADRDAEEADYRYSTAVGVLHSFGEREEAEAVLRRISPGSEDLPVALAFVGRTGEFLKRLDDLTINWVENFWFDPMFANFPAEREFREWTKKVGLAEALERAEAWHAAHPPGKSRQEPPR